MQPHLALSGHSLAPTAPIFEKKAAIYRDQRAGLISMAEAQRRSAALDAPTSRARQLDLIPRSAPRPRQDRAEPRPSRQYAGHMATTAARDDRLTPNAKALLQVIRARCGNGRSTEFTKGTLANVMSRSTRTIRRYLADLVRCGYVETEIRTTGRGLHTGLVVRITEKVLAYFNEAKGLAAWLAETRPLADMPFPADFPGKPRVTLLSPKNETLKESLPWALRGLRKEAERKPAPPS